MVRKRKHSNWKPVPLTENLISKGFDGLVGIEELTNYQLGSEALDNTKQITCKKIFGKQLLKRQNICVTSADGDIQLSNAEGKQDITEPCSKKRKVSHKRKQRKNVVKETTEELQTENNEVHIQLSKAKRKQNITEPSSKKRKGSHKRKQRRNVVKESTEDFQTEKDEAESSDSEVERMSESSKLLDKMSAWNGLDIPSPILRALAEQGFVDPTEIQANTLPAALLGRRDILGAAETGSGKTLAFGIPILHRILEDKKWSSEKLDDAESDQVECNSKESDEELEEENNSELTGLGCVKVISNIDSTLNQNTTDNARGVRLYALVLTPTRELAMQVHKHLVAAAKYTGIKIAVIVGGMASQKQERLLSRRPEIVVATPGRLWELIQDGNPHLAQVSSIKYLAIDETDRMLEKGHFQELHNLLELLNADEGKKRRRQNFVFSATLTMVHAPPQRLKNQNKKLRVTPGQKLQNIMTMLGITNPKVVDVTKESGTAETLTEARITCAHEEKDFYLYYFIQRHKGRTLIFCNSVSCVRRLAQLLTLLQCRPLPLHANMMQRQRLKNLDRFRENPHGLLLATDVAARGLDIPGVQHVIHYQVPRTSESYVHRSGRTARAQNEGLTLLLIEPTEVPSYTRLCRTLGRTKDLPLFPVASNSLAVVKQRVILAREVDQFELTTRRSNSETGWFRKALIDMDMLVDDEDLPRKMDDDENGKFRRGAAVKRKQLETLLSRPLFVFDGQQQDNCDVSNAVKMLKSAVDTKVKHQKKKNVFRKRRPKNKKSS